MLLGASCLGAAKPAKATGEVRIRMAFNSRYAPFSFLNPQGRAAGLVVDLLDLVGLAANIDFDYVDRPWSRSQHMVQTGELDGFCAPSTPDRQEYALFTQFALFEDMGVMVSRADDKRVKPAMTFEDLRALKLGAQIGASWVAGALKGIEIVQVRDIESLLAMIAAGRIDATVAGAAEINAALSASPDGERLRTTPFQPLHGAEFRIGLRRSLPDAEALIERLDEAILHSRRVGAIGQVVARYM